MGCYNWRYKLKILLLVALTMLFLAKPGLATDSGEIISTSLNLHEGILLDDGNNTYNLRIELIDLLVDTQASAASKAIFNISSKNGATLPIVRIYQGEARDYTTGHGEVVTIKVVSVGKKSVSISLRGPSTLEELKIIDRYTIQSATLNESVPPPYLVVKKSVSKAKVTQGETVTFTIRLENPGNTTVKEIRVIDPLPPEGFTHVAGYEQSRSLPELEEKESKEWSYAFKTVKPGNYTIQPAEAFYKNQYDITNSSRSLPFQVEVVEPPREMPEIQTRVEIDRNTITEGESFNLEVTVENTGKVPAKLVSVLGTAPSGIKVKSGDGLRPDPISTLYPGQKEEYHTVLTAETPGTYNLTFKTQYTEAEDKPQTITVSITVIKKKYDFLYLLLPVTAILIMLFLIYLIRRRAYRY